MSKGDTAENDTLKAFLKGTDPSWRTNANRYLALHTADPGEAGSQTTNETAYTGYVRIAVSTAAGWTDNGSSFANAALLQFGQCSGSPGAAITHVSIGTLVSGAGQILYSGALNASLAIANLIQPQFAIAALTVAED